MPSEQNGPSKDAKYIVHQLGLLVVLVLLLGVAFWAFRHFGQTTQQQLQKDVPAPTENQY